ncbi:kinase-like domain-containing protein [Fusarium pseudoanthophilum]|uniref:Kinase-like domain-containing protein n=1 Tax=Fusarium pseudoanthophilum TaxID=48495 RepID=A0A8H5L2A2_9HYPO|nr:kinase-like domain-containing protein [Fusarium pseudoanthophilum]
MSSDPRPSTPPHHPNFGVRMSRDSIDRLVRHILPDTTDVEVEALPSLKSFNNRIYYLKCHKGSRTSSDATHVDELVLKINGRGFGSEKIENEVSCLLLLEHFCPQIPAPRAIAWSQDGITIDSKDAQRGDVKLNGVDESPSGWILMTRVSGKPINLSTLGNDDKLHLATQLADQVTNWRRNVPPQKYAGNVSFHQVGCQPDIEIPSSNSNSEMQFVIRGMLGEELHCQDSIASLAEYYKLRIENKMNTLETNETFAPNRDLIQPVETFIQQDLPTISSLNTKDDSFVFTHYDLSPRNILVSGQPPQITGIVDFEFSGFFPPLDEFLNDCIANDGDWPKDMYEVYLKRLESNGVPTPLEGIKKDHWEQMALLEELVEKIAPWWLPGKFQGEQLKQELSKVKARVGEILKEMGEKEQPWVRSPIGKYL